MMFSCFTQHELESQRDQDLSKATNLVSGGVMNPKLPHSITSIACFTAWVQILSGKNIEKCISQFKKTLQP